MLRLSFRHCLPCCLAVTLLAASPSFASPMYAITDLGDLPGGSDLSEAFDINDAGQVVGYGNVPTGSRAFLWTSSGGMTNLGDLPGGNDYSIAWSVNASTQVVGSSQTGALASDHAFIWDSSAGMVDLNDYVSGSGWTLTEARAIDDLGHIVGYGTNPDGKIRAFLLTPEPSSVALMGIGLAALVMRRRRRAG